MHEARGIHTFQIRRIYSINCDQVWNRLPTQYCPPCTQMFHTTMLARGPHKHLANLWLWTPLSEKKRLETLLPCLMSPNPTNPHPSNICIDPKYVHHRGTFWGFTTWAKTLDTESFPRRILPTMYKIASVCHATTSWNYTFLPPPPPAQEKTHKHKLHDCTCHSPIQFFLPYELVVPIKNNHKTLFEFIRTNYAVYKESKEHVSPVPMTSVVNC